MEIWKDVKGYEKHYKVSNLGRVKSVKFNKEKVLSKTKLSNGYLKVLLCKNGKSKTKTVHSLVAESFLNHKSNIYIVVDHINNIKTDILIILVLPFIKTIINGNLQLLLMVSKFI